MDGLEQSAHGDPLATAQVIAQLSDHPLEFGENDVDRYSVVRFCNTRSRIASRCFDAKPDQLPCFQD